MENCKVPEKCLFSEVIGNRVSDHDARNIYIKVFLKVAVPWILFDIKNTFLKQQVCSKILTICVVQVLSPEHISPVVLLSRNFSVH